MKKLTWHTFAGGTGAPEGKNSYQAVTGGLNGREMYLIDPVADSRGRFVTYRIKYFGPRGYEDLGMKQRAVNAKTTAQRHYAGLAVATNPRPRIGTRKVSRPSSATGRAPSRRLVARRSRNSRKGYFPNPIPVGKFSAAHLSKLRTAYATVQGVDPAGPEYVKLISVLNELSPAQLKQLAEANIKFVSALARNRLPRRKVSGSYPATRSRHRNPAKRATRAAPKMVSLIGVKSGKTYIRLDPRYTSIGTMRAFAVQLARKHNQGIAIKRR